MSEIEDTPTGLGAMLTAESPTTEAAENPSASDAERKRRKRVVLLVILAVALLLLGSLFAWYLITRKPITAIPGLVVTQTPHYAYSLENTLSPLGVAVTADGGRIYVSHEGQNVPVSVLDRNGAKLGDLKFPAAKGVNHTADYVAISPKDGSIYVSDRLAKAVYVYAADGSYAKTLAPTAMKASWEPLAITVGPDGTVFVADVRANGQQVVAMNSDGAIIRTYTVTEKGSPGLTYPNGLAVDPAGDLVVADSNNGRVLRFDSSGKATVLVSSGVAQGDVGMPRGVIYDEHGRLMVVDTVNGVVNVYSIDDPTSKASFISSWGSTGIADGQFSYPNGITEDSRAKFYVTDRANNRVQVWSY